MVIKIEKVIEDMFNPLFLTANNKIAMYLNVC